MENKETTQTEKHFVLVHGACYGAWCWYRVVTILKASGHKVTALDMAASGVHPTQAEELKSIAEYGEPLMEFMEGLGEGEKVILVGHSRGGLLISMAMERFPEKIQVAVFVAANMHGPELSYDSILEEHARRLDYNVDSMFAFGDGPERPPTAIVPGPKIMASMFFQLSPPEDLMLATYLARTSPLNPDQSKLKEIAITKEKYGSVRRAFILCKQDLVMKGDTMRWMIEHHPPDEARTISGADHMVMFSKPRELCTALEEIADHYPRDFAGSTSYHRGI